MAATGRRKVKNFRLLANFFDSAGNERKFDKQLNGKHIEKNMITLLRHICIIDRKDEVSIWLLEPFRAKSLPFIVGVNCQLIQKSY